MIQTVCFDSTVIIRVINNRLQLVTDQGHDFFFFREMKLFIITSVRYFIIKRKQSNIPKLFPYIYIKQKRIQITTCSANVK